VTKKFVIAIAPSNPLVVITGAERDALSQSLKESGCNYWHWFPDLWLIDDPQWRSVEQWRDHARQFFQSAQVLVLEITGQTTWSAFVFPEGTSWLSQYWK